MLMLHPFNYNKLAFMVMCNQEMEDFIMPFIPWHVVRENISPFLSMCFICHRARFVQFPHAQRFSLLVRFL